MLILGVDPGAQGAVSCLTDEGKFRWSERTPMVGKEYDLPAMVELLRVCEDPDGQIVAIEQVGAARVAGRQQGGSSMFAFGRGYGIWLGIVAALGLRRIDVPPQAWTKALLAGMPRAEDPARRPAQRKENAVLRAKALWPEIPIKCKRDWGMADAALIAEYARRTYAPDILHQRAALQDKALRILQ